MSNYGTPPQYPPPGGYEPPIQDTPAPSGELASWLPRVGAFVIDYLLLIPGLIIVSAGGRTSTTGGSSAVVLLGELVILGVMLWNRWLKGGRGQSVGKQVLGLRLVGEATGAPIGTLKAFLRDLAHFFDSVICYVGYLFPLWDSKRQTLADKVVRTVVLRA